jgi:hypothetical protein
MMTAFTMFVAPLAVMLATGRGSAVARAKALPVFFGMFIELAWLLVVPVLYCGIHGVQAGQGLSPKGGAPFFYGDIAHGWYIDSAW